MPGTLMVEEKGMAKYVPVDSKTPLYVIVFGYGLRRWYSFGTGWVLILVHLVVFIWLLKI